MKNLANILFAEQFSGGVPAAIDACPAAGCVIYAISPKVNRNLGNIDPGSKAITIYLGPYTYNVNAGDVAQGVEDYRDGRVRGSGRLPDLSGGSDRATAPRCSRRVEIALCL